MQIKNFTVTMELTTPEENLTDLLNTAAIIAFQSGVRMEDLMDALYTVAENQYFESFLHSDIAEKKK